MSDLVTRSIAELPQDGPWADAWWVCAGLRDAGFEGVAVGGAVRDLLVGDPVADVDIATSATPDQVEQVFPKTFAVGKQFGVIIVCCPSGQHIEVASFRADGIYIDGRRPEGIVLANEATDVARRDFTINGLILDPAAQVVRDRVGGLADSDSGRLRVIGDPHARLAEDRLRVLRGIRFAARFNLTIDPATMTALRETAMTDLSRERIWDEWGKGLRSATPGRWWRLVVETGHQAALHPGLGNADLRTLSDQLERLDAGDPVVAQALILGHAGADRNWLKREPISREHREAISWLIDRRSDAWWLAAVAERRRLLRQPSARHLPRWCLAQAWGPEQLAELQLALDREAADPLAPLLGAADLMTAGVARGPALGRWLQELETAQLEGVICDRQQALDWLVLHMTSDAECD